MDAIVLAGGFATRLWPITRDRPKMLLPIGETTVIGTVLEAIERDDRIDDVYVSTNEKFEAAFESYLSESDFEKPRLSVEQTTTESEKLGVIGALAQLIDREGLDDDALIIGGDNLISFDVSEFVDAFETAGDPLLAAYDVGSYERASSYGLIEVDSNGEVVDFQEKPDDPNSTLVSIACYALPAETLSLFDAYLDGGNNPDEPGWFIQWLQDRTSVRAFTFEPGGSSEARSSESRTGGDSETQPQGTSREDERQAKRGVSQATRETGAWFDIGTSDSYLDAVEWYLDGGNYVASSADVESATVGANVQVLEGATLTDVEIERSVVFPDAEIVGCEIRDSIIDRGTRVEAMNLSGALIGAHTRLGNGRL